MRLAQITGLIILMSGLAGCSKFRPAPVQVVSDGKVPKSIERGLLDLASARDFIGQQNPGTALLKQITDDDQERMFRYMQSRGYYDASMSVALPVTGKVTRVDYRLTPGPIYRFHAIHLSWPEHYTGPRPGTESLIDDFATTRSIKDVERKTRSFLREQGYPNAQASIREVVVDHAARNIDAFYNVHPGDFARFGKLNTEGFKHIRTSYARKAKPWQEGALYQQSLVDEMERRMAGGGVFSLIDIEHDQTVARENEEDYHLKLKVRERPPRTIQVGAGYRSDTGAEISTRWQHRNALGGGENFIFRAKWSEVGEEAEARVTVPFFRRGDQSWSTSLKFAREDSDAYLSESFKGESLITREVTTNFTLRGGFALRYLDEQQGRESDYFYLGSLPVRFLWDYANDPLDASKGYRLFLSTEPFQSIEGRDPFFWKNQLGINGYVPFGDEERFSLALRLTAGSITADSTRDVPAELRYYAGGAQSVRGYAYQSLSPRDGDNEIVGGLSLAETSLEIRAKFSRRFGAVAFIDGGAAYEDNTPDLEETIRWGAGLGFRYFTAVGPVRIDAAFPLDRREGIDDAWQFYVSLGQSF